MKDSDRGKDGGMIGEGADECKNSMVLFHYFFPLRGWGIRAMILEI
jgi:hypothetical protein